MVALLGSASDFLQKVLKPVSSVIPFGGEKSYLTLDIGTSSVEMLEIQKKVSVIYLTSAGFKPLQADGVKGSMIQDPGSVSVQSGPGRDP